MPNRPWTPGAWLPALTIAVLLAAPAAPVAAAHATLVVAKDGQGSPKDCDAPTPTPYTTIGAAVAAAQAGDLIKVCPGVYAEQVVIAKSLALEGENVAVCPSNANAVIIFQSHGVRVRDNVLGLSQTGVFVEGDDNTVTHNRVFDTQVFDGVAVFGNHNRIHQNEIVRSDESAIFIDGDHNKVEGNRINEAPVGILKSGTGNVFAGNRFFNTPTPDPVAGPAGSRASPQRSSPATVRLSPISGGASAGYFAASTVTGRSR